ncbi:meiosis-specific nuclear structural protein 1 [Patella vulgata]|uniref:meiosis-specific nuclear structural protein 1 n=1 Tax=Patella vulgata TaxID=6465 RepID=UPI0024A90D48|nr:meiosis-specific nuclear structural protein 1 [Patella vulgata]
MTTVRRQQTSMRDRELDKSRRQEEMREDTLHRLSEEKMLTSNMNREERIDDKRFLRRQQLEQKEREMEEAILKAERDRIIRNQQFEQEDRLAKELQQLNQHKLRDEKTRQQIRESSLELRELEAKLKAAYMNKERSAQLAEKDVLKYEQMKRDSEIAREMKKQHERASAEEEKRLKERYHEQVRYQQELERQLEEQEVNRQKAYEEFLKEKLMIDEIVRKIYEEDQKEMERQMHKRKATQQYIEEFKKSRSMWKDEERHRMEEENRRILEFANVQKERELGEMQAKKTKEEAMDRVQKQLSEKIAAREKEREEMERVQMELYLEEQEERERRKELSEVERKFRQRIDLQETHARQMHFKALRLQAEKDEEEIFRQVTLAKFAEDDRIEQMNAQKRRMKQLEHKRSVEALIEERRRSYTLAREKEIAEVNEASKMEQFRRQIIEEERQRLLREHATKLLGFLPKGVIQNEQDLEMLGPEFKSVYRQQQIDPFDDEAWENGNR